ncbi:MAG: sugar ABC transporter permease [Geminicoccaceae bacterium]|nr:sugar ABC transporter permease [Geminicoccaceae bacterium]
MAAPAVAGGAPRRRAGLGLERAADSRGVYGGLVVVALAFLLAFVGYPLIYNLLMSFQEVTLSTMARLDRPWVGAANFEAVFADPLFWLVLRNSLAFTIACVVCQVALGFALALFFSLRFSGAAWFRGVILAGWILPLLVVGAIFKWLYATNGGLVNEALLAAGLVTRPVNWLSSPDLSLLSIILANIWYGTPFAMILLAAGLAGLPGELYEAAHLDGAGPWQRFRWVTLPLMKPTLLAVLTLCTIYTLRAFDLLFSMTGGGPAFSSTTLPLWSFVFSFQQFDFGKGAAIASLMFVVVIVAGALYVRSLRTEVRL